MFIIKFVFLTISIPSLASFVFGVWSLFQCLPIEATEKKEAEMLEKVEAEKKEKEDLMKELAAAKKEIEKMTKKRENPCFTVCSLS